MYGVAMVIDGFISSVAALCAEKLCPKCSDFMIASHVSKESCTADILELLGKKAPINADMCLGEGKMCIRDSRHNNAYGGQNSCTSERKNTFACVT